jgi:hypothetical protein
MITKSRCNFGNETTLTGLLNPMTLDERARFLSRFAMAFRRAGGTMRLAPTQPARAERRPWEVSIERYVGEDE